MSVQGTRSRSRLRKGIRYIAPLLFWASLIPLVLVAILYPLSYFKWIQYSQRATPTDAIRQACGNASNGVYHHAYLCNAGVFVDTWFYSSGNVDRAGWSVLPGVMVPRRPLSQEQLFPNSWGVGHRQIPMWYVAAPFVIAMILLRRFRRFPQPGYCDQCGFDLYCLDTKSCPECGTPIGMHAAEHDMENRSVPCTECLGEVSLSDTACSQCGAVVDPEQTKWAAFHMRPIVLSKDLRDAGFLGIMKFLLLSFRPAALWTRVIIRRPPAVGFTVAIGVSVVACALLAMAVISVITWGDVKQVGPGMFAVSADDLPKSAGLAFFISFLAPFFGMSGLTLLSRRARRTSNQVILLCYLAAMPILVAGAVVSLMLSFLPAPWPFLVLAGFIVYWTYAVRRAFRSYGPVRPVARWIVAGHAFGILVGPPALVAMGWGIGVLQGTV